jgi:hypothetical protein
VYPSPIAASLSLLTAGVVTLTAVPVAAVASRVSAPSVEPWVGPSVGPSVGPFVGPQPSGAASPVPGFPVPEASASAAATASIPVPAGFPAGEISTPGEPVRPTPSGSGPASGPGRDGEIPAAEPIPSATPTSSTTPSPSPVVRRPTRRSVLRMTSPAWDRLRLSWSAVPGATSYRIASGGRVIKAKLTTRMWVRTGLAPTWRYNGGVQGCNAAGCGPWSVTVIAATARPPSSQPRQSAVSAQQLPYTYRRGCPVGPSRLRRVTLWYWDFSGRVKRGELIVRDGAVRDVAYVFERAYRSRFRIRQMRRVDVWRGSDIRAMAADNTSMFNCRGVTGNPYRLSRHSYGDAADINPFENPYKTRSRIYPTGSSRYMSRQTYRTGMIMPRSPFATAMRARGWLWGARWSNPDYQHWSKTGA